MEPSELVAVEHLPADRHPARVYLASLSPGSQRTMSEALNTIANLLTSGRADAWTIDWSAVRRQHVQAVRALLAERYSVAMTNKVLAALRGVLREAWRLGFMDGETFMRASDVRTVRGETLPRGRALSAGELTALLRICLEDRTPAGPRDAACIAVLYGAGLRRSEAVGLDMSDYDPETGGLTIRQAKGRKDRQSWINGGAKLALADWIAVRGLEPGPLLWAVNRHGALIPGRLSGEAIFGLLRKRCAQAGIPVCSPHDLRRSFVSDLLGAGADLSVVQKLAGHAQVSTTQRYDMRGEVAKRQAVERLVVPYSGRT